MKTLLEKVRELFPEYTWLEEPCQIETEEEDFCCDVETVLEYTDHIFDENVKIEQEICFESDEETFCHVYTDKNLNINRIFINID